MISKVQIENMSHALGLNYKKIPFRNRYNCDSDTNWDDLVCKGYALKYEVLQCAGKYMYVVSPLGISFIQRNPDLFNIDKRLLKMCPLKMITKYEL